MSLLDTVTDIFVGGADDWQARLATEIVLTSPEGQEFRAKWRRGSRGYEKKLGVLGFPKIKGNVVKDFDVNSTKYEIPIYFDGKDCDLYAEAFFQSGRLRDTWMVSHPQHGDIELQLVSLKQIDEPVENGGMIQFDTEWIEPIDPTTLQTAAEMAGLVSTAVDDLNVSAAEEFAAKLNATSQALKNKIEFVTDGIQNLVDAALGPLFAGSDFLRSSVLAIQNGIQDTMSAIVFEPLSLAGQIQQLIQLPVLATNDIVGRLDYYGDLADRIMSGSSSPSSPTLAARNTATVNELALLAVTASNAKIATTGVTAAQTRRAIAAGQPVLAGQATTVIGRLTGAGSTPATSTINADNNSLIATRAQAVGAAQRILDSFEAYCAYLDSLQEAFEANSVDKQYFAALDAYSKAARAVALTAQFLLRSAYDLSVERRFTLTRPRTPVEIVVKEYGGLGINDSNLDLFLLSNGITGLDTYLLPAGREVVIYG